MSSEGKIWLKSVATVAVMIALAALMSLYESPRERQVKQMLAAQQQAQAARAEHGHAIAPRYSDLMGRWRNMGVGSLPFQGTEPGEYYPREGGSGFYKTLQGDGWFTDFEPMDRRDVPLDTRLVYMVHVSNDAAKGCGEKLEDFTKLPAKCFVEEKIITWPELKQFLWVQIKDPEKTFGETERFLRSRSQQ